MKEKKHIVVLTGAGISAESGLKTFRDSDGLWNGYAIEDVATPAAWQRNPQLVLDFYNQRFSDLQKVVPNLAHLTLAQWESWINVSIITQNVDDLHERAGSSQILHLHGELNKMRSEGRREDIKPYHYPLTLAHRDDIGFQYRPHIVWFGEEVPEIENAIELVQSADVLLIIGTSLQVYPAAGLVNYAAAQTPILILDKQIPESVKSSRIIPIEDTASNGIAAVEKWLRSVTTK